VACAAFVNLEFGPNMVLKRRPCSVLPETPSQKEIHVKSLVYLGCLNLEVTKKKLLRSPVVSL
jgi:hypothetical protein